MSRAEVLPLAHQVSLTLGDHVEDFDIDAIVGELNREHGPLDSIDAVESSVYWTIVRRHDTTLKEQQ